MSTSTVFRAAALAAGFLLGSLALVASASAKDRHALIVGISAYKKANGLPALSGPVEDARQMKAMLEDPAIGFRVDLLTDDDIKDKAQFEAAFARFLARIKPKDEVVFYFSGHGYHAPLTGNYLLLPDAKSQPVYLKGLGTAEARDLDTPDKKDKSYRDWVERVALSESAIERAIAARDAEVVVLIIDACRSLITDAKGAAIETSKVSLPRNTARGIYRLYSASPGQVSLDASRGERRRGSDDDDDDDEDDAKTKRKGKSDRKSPPKSPDELAARTSLFTRVLLRHLREPEQEINILFARVKIDVREQARRQGHEQIPDYNDAPDSSDFFFRSLADRDQLDALCQSVAAEISQLRYGVISGSIGRSLLEAKRLELARCKGAKDSIDLLLRLESQGAGALSTDDRQRVVQIDPNDPLQQCDARASSPLDPSRPEGTAGVEIQQLALAAISGEVDAGRARTEITAALEACEQAVRLRPRVARYMFNLARSSYAYASLGLQVDQVQALERASRYYQQAVDLGYAAAYNDLALMHQRGEFHDPTANPPGRQLPDRRKAAELLMAGARLGHTLALYNLGMAYKNGDLGLQTGVETDKRRDALAFQFLSRSAERGYVPAMIETALALDERRGIEEPNPKRAIELLELSASRGSWEAMYQLGRIFSRTDAPRAIIWHARAAEAGDSRSQEALAEMLANGRGLPAPQREAAGRYWRLSADSGSRRAQFQLANLLRDGNVPFRPRLSGPPDNGAQEIRDLYLAAFTRGEPDAGLELARLFRSGFPKDRGSKAIPRNPKIAADLLWQTIAMVRSAPEDSLDAHPITEFRAAFELIAIHAAGERPPGGGIVITDDEIAQLRRDYGDGSRLSLVRVAAIADRPVECRVGKEEPRRVYNDYWVYVWDWNRPEPPTEMQFNWWERYNRCKEKKWPGDKRKDEEFGVTKRIRDAVKKEYEAAQKDAKKDQSKAKSFHDRMVELVNARSSKSR